MSAAAFAKGLLDLEGQLTPILVSLVSKDSSMLDGLDNASIEMEEAKVVFSSTLLPHDIPNYFMNLIFFNALLGEIERIDNNWSEGSTGKWII